MSLKLLAVNGSVTRHSRTGTLLRTVLDGAAKAHPEIETELLELAEYRLDFCDGRDPWAYAGSHGARHRVRAERPLRRWQGTGGPGGALARPAAGRGDRRAGLPPQGRLRSAAGRAAASGHPPQSPGIRHGSPGVRGADPGEFRLTGVVCGRTACAAASSAGEDKQEFHPIRVKGRVKDTSQGRSFHALMRALRFGAAAREITDGRQETWNTGGWDRRSWK